MHEYLQSNFLATMEFESFKKRNEACSKSLNRLNNKYKLSQFKKQMYNGQGQQQEKELGPAK